MEKAPKVSVVTPTYNRADLLPETIESILRQSFSDFEYIIVDDGSADNTREVVMRYAKEDPRIQYVYQPNGGDTAAVNHGWQLAKGRYFVQVNSDDPVLPGLFAEMTAALDAHPDAVVAYCDFQKTDENGAVLSTERLPDWDFFEALGSYNCCACGPGTFIRKTALPDWDKLRRYEGYKLANDTAMMWDIALRGDFIHVQRVLATFRQHVGQLSHSEIGYVSESERWFSEYFANPSLPEAIRQLRQTVRNSIFLYQEGVVRRSDLCLQEKTAYLLQISKRRLQGDKAYINLQISDNDLIGNKFNGHNLHLYLNQNGVRSFSCIRNPKESDDPDTFCIPHAEGANFAEQILHSRMFHLSDIVHLHHIHNTDFDLQYLPALTRLKPTVITLHECFFLGGHCVHHFDCERWKTQCFDCPYPDVVFPMTRDDSALQFAMKRQAVQNSDISVIVATKWMEEKVKQSPVFAGKEIYVLPFGIDQTVFMPADIREAKAALGISPDALVLMFRSDLNAFKGRDVIENALQKLQCDREVVLLTVVKAGCLQGLDGKYRLMEFGWVADDRKLEKLYQACDLFLMPSRQESFGMMALEAMSCGRMVLATTGSALPDTVHAPECGIAVDEQDYAAELQRLIDHPDEIRERGDRCLAYARANHSLERYVAGMREVYADVMKKHAPDVNAALVTEQVLRYTAVDYSDPKKPRIGIGAESLLDGDLFRTFSWRVTKPIRAFQNARLTRRGFMPRMRYFFMYLGSRTMDRQSDADILASNCWKITSPLRKIARCFHK